MPVLGVSLNDVGQVFQGFYGLCLAVLAVATSEPEFISFVAAYFPKRREIPDDEPMLPSNIPIMRPAIPTVLPFNLANNPIHRIPTRWSFVLSGGQAC